MSSNNALFPFGEGFTPHPTPSPWGRKRSVPKCRGVLFELPMVPRRLYIVQDVFQDGPVSLMMIQDGLRWLQDGKIKLPSAFQAWQKWHPVEARRRFSAKCMLLHRCLQDGPKVAPKCPKLNPRWPQYGSKMAQEGPQMASRDVFSCPRGVSELGCPPVFGPMASGMA